MNIIDTSLISDPNVQQGFTGISLAFLQSATKEAINGVCKALIGSVYNTSDSFIIYGCIRTGAEDGAASGTASVSDGYIFYNEELYYVPAFTTANINSQNLYISVSDTATDTTPFSDSSTHSVNHVRRIVVTQAASGTTLFNSTIDNNWHTIGAPGEPAFANSWTNAPGSVAKYKVQNGSIYFTGNIIGGLSGTYAFQIPNKTGYRPTTRNQRGVLIGGDSILYQTDGKVFPTYSGTSNVILDATIINLE